MIEQHILLFDCREEIIVVEWWQCLGRIGREDEVGERLVSYDLPEAPEVERNIFVKIDILLFELHMGIEEMNQFFICALFQFEPDQ